MKKTLITAFIAAAPALLAAAGNTAVTGDYVEARTAEVFAGGCIQGSEGEALGREAILAWRVGSGQVDGVPLDGLSVVAVVASDLNLSTHEIGGARPQRIRTAIRVDARATEAQRTALVAMAKSLSPVVRDIVDVKAVPISFTRDADRFAVTAGEASLEVATKMDHSPNCGAMRWYDPLAKTTQTAMGHTNAEAWSGTSLGTQWSMGDKRASFYGAFELK
ncbi:MAG TPA: DUF1326 domain-containing protein [Vicinamibacterales bacterium]|nr:DUF1326 domain-containing protein [Vicinamibacterales bacterium]